MNSQTPIYPRPVKVVLADDHKFILETLEILAGELSHI